MHGQKATALYCAMAIFASYIAFFSGCAGREELEEARRQQAPGYDAEADEALEKAENAMIEAGIEINFSEQSGLESLTDLRAILPDPMEIRQLEKQQKMEEAITALHTALDALGRSGASLAPARALADSDGGSDTDVALIHLHLSYCYILSAVSRLARVGLGPDGVLGTADDLYYISFPEELEVENVEVYKFMLTDKGQALMDSVDPSADPYGYIKVFYSEGQVEALQAILDSLLLLLDAEVVIIASPAEGIKAQEPQIDRQTYRSNALYHLTQALELARILAPELEDALDEFDGTITEYFSKEILENAIEWGFEIRSVPQRYEHLLEQ
jgi:hypothetical protein